MSVQPLVVAVVLRVQAALLLELPVVPSVVAKALPPVMALLLATMALLLATMAQVALPPVAAKALAAISPLESLVVPLMSPVVVVPVALWVQAGLRAVA